MDEQSKSDEPEPKKYNGYTPIDNWLFDQILSDKTLNGREIRAVLLVIRFTIGVRLRFCQLRKSDFELANIRANHATSILKSCMAKKWLYFYEDENTHKTHYSIPVERLKQVGFVLSHVKAKRIIKSQITKRSYKKQIGMSFFRPNMGINNRYLHK